ncbi:MAG: aminotransferase class I/II-fold pyridoxal phosphate-dependent enzyme [Verrucomicrobiae bacterium]|nr:aminotransferase class I/II-fold pyridoxal phosphate-dependent enzyme [Verrucomicrobiae bacterium]
MKTDQASSSLIARHVQAIPRSGIRDFFDIVSTMKDVVSLGIGEPDFITPWHIREAGIYALEKGRTCYTSNLGLLRLRREISKYVENVFRVPYHPEREIIVTVGVSEAMDLALRALINPGDEIIYHEPCYVSYSPSIVLAHGIPVPVSTGVREGWKVTAEAIEKALTPRTKAVILNFPTNPTGGTMPLAELEKIAALAIRHNLVVLTDEIYSELTYEGVHHSIAALPGMRDRTIFLHGFSKAFAMTGFRIGYACASPPLLDAMMRIHQYSMLCAPIVSQEAAIEALAKGESDMIQMRGEYEKRRNFIVNSLNSLGLDCHLPHGAFYAFPSIARTGIGSRDFALGLLDSQRVAVVPGNAFGACGEGFIRCSYATSLEKIETAMKRLDQYMQTRFARVHHAA